MALDFSVQSLQFRRRNNSGNMTLRYVWDIVSRADSPARMLIESWGGKPDGYIKSFGTDLMLGRYLSGRIGKATGGVGDDDIGLDLVGAESYKISGPLNRLGKALQASNHEKAKVRLNISGMSNEWDNEACLNKVMSGIIDFDDEGVTCDQLNQGMASRVKTTFKTGGNYAENIVAIDDFMTSAEDDLADVLGGEPVVYPPMDRERIAEVIQLADGLRETMAASVSAVKEPTLNTDHIPEPTIERGSEWGGWA